MLSPTNNRTDPIFRDTNCLNTLNLGLTLRCTMKCPYCSVGVPKYKEDGSAEHASLKLIYGHSKLLRPLRRVHLTGGEPMMHPNFELLSRVAKDWFGAQYLTLETNGTLYWKFKDTLRNFDKVFITHYQKDAIYPGSPDNTAAIEDAQDTFGDKIIREEPIRHERSHGAVEEDLIQLTVNGAWGEEPCSKWHDPGLPAGWYDGLLYKCCVTVGISRKLGIPVTENWREELPRQWMGCDICLYRGT